MNTTIDLAETTKIAISDRDIWNEATELCLKHGALDIGMGIPNIRPPQYLLEALSAAVKDTNPMNNQYTRTYGLPTLVKALAGLYSRTLDRTIDAMTEVIVTPGALNALYYSFQSFINPGDEVILIEPFYTEYQRMLKFLGAKIVYIPLKPQRTRVEENMSSDDWTFDVEELKKAFSHKTKAIVVNNPSNPLGKVFSRNELNEICKMCIQYDILCISDEVCEWLVFDNKQHIRTACIPGMWERTITIGSAGKTFCVTGWKLGWAVGPDSLIKGLRTNHDMISRHVSTPTQVATAIAIETELSRFDSEECFYKSFPREMETKRDLMMMYLEEAGITAIKPSGGFFVVANTSNMVASEAVAGNLGRHDDAYEYRFIKWFIQEKKLCVIPVSTFYGDDHKHFGEKYIRICFVKNDETLEKARTIFNTLKKN